MNPLQLRLASLRRRMIFVNFWRGSCTLFAVIAGILLVEGLTDWKTHLPAPLRGLFLVGTLVAAGTVFVRYLYLPLTKRLDDLSLALRIEEIYPELNDNLASAVQFLDEPEENLPGSKIMRKQAIEHALKRADHCDFGNIIDRRGVLLRPAAALLVGLLAAHFIYHDGAFTCKAMARLADPFGGHTWTEVDVPEPPIHIAQGQTFTVTGRVTGIIPEKGRIEFDDASPQRVMYIEKDGTFQLPLDLSQPKFRFRILANDGTYPAHGGWTHEIQVKAPPHLVPLGDGQLSPQIDLEFPAYTDLSPKRLIPSLGQVSVEAVEGTKIHWRAAVDRPIVAAWLELPEGKVDCQIDGPSRNVLSISFTPKPAATPTVMATIHYKDELDLTNTEKMELAIFADPAPSIQLKKPVWAIEKLLPTAQITMDMVVLDRKFAIRSVYLEYRRKNSVGDGWVDNEWRKVPIAHADLIGLFAALGQDYRGLALPVRVRPEELEFTAAWQLRGLFKKGDLVSFRACADDFNDLILPRPVGRTRDYEFLIVGEREFVQDLDDQLEKAQKNIVLLQEEQKEAKKIVDDVLDGKKDGDPQTQRKKLIAAEQMQAHIKEIIANSRDGLLKSMDDLKERMLENKLPPSSVQDNVKAIAKALDRLNRVNLPQIEDNLANALRQVGKPEVKPENTPDAKPETKPDGKPDAKPGAKPEPKKKDPLEQARSFQEDTHKTLAELAKFLDPWANQQQIKDRIIKLTAQQKDLKRDTEALTDKSRKEDLDPRAKRQGELADQADDLLKTIKEVMARLKGTEGADKLAEAEKIAAEAKLPVSMREVRDQLRQTNEPRLNDSVQKQEKIIDDLGKMLAALDEAPHEQQVEKLVKKHKDAQKDVAKLQEKMNDLERRVKEARNTADPMEREAKLKKLAPEQKKLEEEARALSRELARLQADQASRDLDRAADNMEQAAARLARGEDPGGDAQQQMKKNVEHAKADLQEAEEELARERLAGIAIRLEDIQKRETAALAETERIHKTLLEKNQWSRGLQQSLSESGDVQLGLADKTALEIPKLHQSPVFEYVLKKAKDSMNKAAKAIADRKSRALAEGAVAGKSLDKDLLDAENKDQDKIVKLQKDASDRLGGLIVDLKQEPPKKTPQKPKDPPKNPDEKNPDKKEEPKQQKMLPSGDGIPPTAEIKQLIKLQDEYRKNTKEFNDRVPDRANMSPEQLQELRALADDQRRIGELFHQLMNRGKEKGDQP